MCLVRAGSTTDGRFRWRFWMMAVAVFLISCSTPRPYDPSRYGSGGVGGQGGTPAHGSAGGSPSVGGQGGQVGTGVAGPNGGGNGGDTDVGGGGSPASAGVGGRAGGEGGAMEMSLGGRVGTGIGGVGGSGGTGLGAGQSGSGAAGVSGAGGKASGSGGESTGCGSSFCSCQSLATTCGPNRNEDCCSRRAVPQTVFSRYDNNLYPATISGYSMDRFEVTVGRFRQFVSAGRGVQTAPPSIGSGKNPKNTLDQGWQNVWTALLLPTTSALRADLVARHSAASTWTDAAGANEDLPMTQVSWAEAQAFCIWDEGRLPTEAEWELASVGGAEQREFPFPHAADCTLQDPGNPSNCCNYMNTGCGPSMLSVGSKSPAGDGRWGHADLGGNAAEWAFDVRSANSSPTPPVPCYDCSNWDPNQDAHLAMNWAPGTFWTNATVASFLKGYDGRTNSIGIRCVHD